MAKYNMILLAILASVNGDALNRVSGWSSGWTTTPPPPTPGWTTMPPTDAPGWGPPPPAGWGPPPSSNVEITLTGELAAVAVGAASESHSENIQVTGDGIVPAELIVAAGGESTIYQEGSIVQVTNVDNTSASTLNAVSLAQAAVADEGAAILASGLDVVVAQSGVAEVAGVGISAASADTSIVANQ